MTPADWNALASRCEAARGADRDLAKDIARALSLAPAGIVTQGYGWREDESGWWLATGDDARIVPKRIDPPRVLSSLDAITALVERELPGRMWAVWRTEDAGKAAIDPTALEAIYADAAAPALALCAAFCRAKGDD